MAKLGVVNSVANQKNTISSICGPYPALKVKIRHFRHFQYLHSIGHSLVPLDIEIWQFLCRQ